MNDIANEKYVSLTTYKKDGTPVSGPVWIADLGDGTLGFTTSANSWKAKRLGNNPKLTLVACNARGKVADGTTEVEGTGTVVIGSAANPIRAKIKEKYGVQVPLIRLASKVQGLFRRGHGEPDDGVVVTLS